MVTLTHTPSRSVRFPDYFLDEARNTGYTVTPDVDAPDPRADLDIVNVALYVYSGLRASGDETPPENVAAQVFARMRETFSDDVALTNTERYLRIFHPDKAFRLEKRTIRGYCQSDWRDVLAVAAEGYGDPAGYIDEFRAWVFGDVWIVDPDDGELTAGVYADSPEEAVKLYLEQNPPAPIDEVGDIDGDEPVERSYSVSWEIDAEATSPAEAAVAIWRDSFGRGHRQPSNEESCVFEVSLRGEEPVRVDLSDEEYAHLFL